MGKEMAANGGDARREQWSKPTAGKRPMNGPVAVPRPPPVPTFGRSPASATLPRGADDQGSAPTHFMADPAPPVTQPPPPDAGAELARRRRQKIVLSAVCALGAIVFGLAGLRAVAVPRAPPRSLPAQ